MKGKNIISAVCASLMLLGCATTPVYSTYEPIIDRHNIDPAKYQQDLYECRTYAAQVNQDASTANGAIAGGLFIGLLGAALGLRGSDLAQATVAGAAAGAARGNVNAGLTQAQIIANCLTGRGYLVLSM